MNMLPLIISGAISGLIGAFAMYAFMRAVSATFGRRVDMIRALGSYFTGKTEGAVALGASIHAVSGTVFGIFYILIFYAMKTLDFPQVLFFGIGFGFFHGLIMSYILMFYASERHPIKEYRKATMEEGLLHLVGHLIFGGVTGLVSGLTALAFIH